MKKSKLKLIPLLFLVLLSGQVHAKKGGRIRLIEIDQLLKNKFDIHYKNLNGVHIHNP
jgi:hypothetical protein